MLLSSALEKTGIAEASWNGYIFTVRDGQGEFGEDLVLTVQKGAMPPHITKTYASLLECEGDIYTGEFTDMPGLDFKAIEPEQ